MKQKISTIDMRYGRLELTLLDSAKDGQQLYSSYQMVSPFPSPHLPAFCLLLPLEEQL